MEKIIKMLDNEKDNLALFGANISLNKKSNYNYLTVFFKNSIEIELSEEEAIIMLRPHLIEINAALRLLLSENLNAKEQILLNLEKQLSTFNLKLDEIFKKGNLRKITRPQIK